MSTTWLIYVSELFLLSHLDLEQMAHIYFPNPQFKLERKNVQDSHSLFVLILVIFLVKPIPVLPLPLRVSRESQGTVQQVTNVDRACLVMESLHYETLKVEHLYITRRKQ